jgi:hypothetical protein
MPLDDNAPDSLLRDVLPKQPKTPLAPPTKMFKPWHRPRKQYVRKFQWSKEIQSLIEHSHFPDDSKVFRYLSLPGSDLFDVRSIRDICVSNGLSLKYVGFNLVEPGSAEEIQLNLARKDLSGMEGIHAQSNVHIEKFEAIAESKSLAFGHVHAAAPYNCINIDLCDHVASRSQKSIEPTYLDAIGQLIRLQIKTFNQGWLLFLTTRVGHDRVNPRNLRALVDAIQSNCFLHSQFRSGMEQIVHAEGAELISKLRSAQLLTPTEFKDVFCVGFGKWLLALLQTAQPRMEFVKLQSYFYSIVPRKPDMVSLAYLCQPRITVPTDRYRLIAKVSQPAHLSELEMAMTFLEHTRGMANVDELLGKNSDLKNAMIEETEALLRAANYPVDDSENGYRAWLRRENR